VLVPLAQGICETSDHVEAHHDEEQAEEFPNC
jgi:hypothetical protein